MGIVGIAFRPASGIRRPWWYRRNGVDRDKGLRLPRVRLRRWIGLRH